MSEGQEDHEWVRQALTSLGRPDIPDEVRDRLDAAIHAEGRGAGDLRPDHTVSVVTVPAQASRRASLPRRRPWALSLVGAAAALVMFAAIDPFSGAPLPPSDTGEFDIAQAPQSLGSEAAALPGSNAEALQSAPQEQLADFDPVMIASGTNYTRAGFASQVAVTAELTASPSTAVADDGANAAMAPCVAALPPQGQLTFVDRAAFEGKPALVVARQIGVELRVFVQDASCTSADPKIQYRATVEAPVPGAQ